MASPPPPGGEGDSDHQWEALTDLPGVSRARAFRCATKAGQEIDACGKGFDERDRLVVDRLVNAGHFFKTATGGFNWHPPGRVGDTLRAVTRGGPWRQYVVRSLRERKAKKPEVKYTLRWTAENPILESFNPVLCRDVLLRCFDLRWNEAQRFCTTCLDKEKKAAQSARAQLRTEIVAMFEFSGLEAPTGIPDCDICPAGSCKALRVGGCKSTCTFNGGWALEAAELDVRDLFLLTMGIVMFLYSKRNRKGNAESGLSKRQTSMLHADRKRLRDELLEHETARVEAITQRVDTFEAAGPTRFDERVRMEHQCLTTVEAALTRAESVLVSSAFFPVCKRLFYDSHGILHYIKQRIRGYVDGALLDCCTYFQSAEALATRFEDTCRFAHAALGNQMAPSHAEFAEVMQEFKGELARLSTLLEEFLEWPPTDVQQAVSRIESVAFLLRRAHPSAYDKIADALMFGLIEDWRTALDHLKGVSVDSITDACA